MNKCPYCQNDMRKGFVEGHGRYGLLWAGEEINKNVLCRTLSDENSCVILSDPNLFTLSRVKAQYCEICKKIIIDING
ncbi:MAG: hypothetical protein K0S75_1821 [Clostridia bacterium]|jgi:hypothetical protein|nr:hypothetical protein [Clostridia bacterium]